MMLGNDEHKLNSPITPLSFDFNKKKRSKAARSDSPDILKRTSPDIVQRPKKRDRADRGLRSEEDLRSDFSSSDYAPVSTDGWIITDNSQGRYK